MSPYGAFGVVYLLYEIIRSGRKNIVLSDKCGCNNYICCGNHIFNQLDYKRNFQDWVREDEEKDEDKEESEEFIGTKGTFGKCPFYFAVLVKIKAFILQSLLCICLIKSGTIKA